MPIPIFNYKFLVISMLVYSKIFQLYILIYFNSSNKVFCRAIFNSFHFFLLRQSGSLIPLPSEMDRFDSRDKFTDAELSKCNNFVI